MSGCDTATLRVRSGLQLHEGGGEQQVLERGAVVVRKKDPPRWQDDNTIHTCMYTCLPMSSSTARVPAARPRSTQAERSARTRSALLESAARGLSRYGYGNLVLEQVAREAGYTRGALYHQFKDKEELALAVLEWVNETWWREVGEPAERQPDPVAALFALARGHAVYCRRDVARVIMALRVEFSGQDHPVGHEIKRVSKTLVKLVASLIEAGRRDGPIPPGPPARAVARAFWGALEGAVIALAGQAPHDELLAARTVAGVLGLASQTDWPTIS
jgi:AcrR family transcriptional regulator